MADFRHYHYDLRVGLAPLKDRTLEAAFAALRKVSGKDFRVVERQPPLYKPWASTRYMLYLPWQPEENPEQTHPVGKKIWRALSERWLSANSLKMTLDNLTNTELKAARHRAIAPGCVPTASIKAPAQGSRVVTYHKPQEEGQYLNLLRELVDELKIHGATANRTAVKAAKVFGRTMRFNLTDGSVPFLTTKKVSLKSVALELIWFLKGITNNEWLRQRGVTIWEEWATTVDTHDRKWRKLPKGSLGPLYGEQWRRFPAGEFFYNLTADELLAYVNNLPNSPQRTKALCRYCPSGQINDEQGLRKYLTGGGIDQISQALYLLKTRPDSRRIIVTAWNPQVVPSDALSPQENVARRRAALAACHTLFQFVTKPIPFAERVAMIEAHWAEHHTGVVNLADTAPVFTEESIDRYLQVDGKCFPAHRVNLIIYQRSGDALLGVPYNIASYGLLLHMVAKEVNMLPGELLWVGADVHLYANHLEAAETQLRRAPMAFPKVKLRDVDSLFDYTLDDITLEGYAPQAAIKAEVAV